MAFLPILSDTRNFIKYSVTTLDEGEWIMLMKRPVISATGTGLLAPFTFSVWILILISLLVVGPLIYCIIFVRNWLTGDRTQRQYGLPHCMWFVYGALLKQGSTLSPISGTPPLSVNLIEHFNFSAQVLVQIKWKHQTRLYELLNFVLCFYCILYQTRHALYSLLGGFLLPF